MTSGYERHTYLDCIKTIPNARIKRFRSSTEPLLMVTARFEPRVFGMPSEDVLAGIRYFVKCARRAGRTQVQ